MEKIKIAIIEDDAHLRSSIEDYFHISGRYRLVCSADSFKEAAPILAADVPDFVLLDIHLNGESGISLIADIKTSFPDTFIIVVTGDTAVKQLMITAFEKGANSFIYKPFSLKDVEHAIDQILKTGSFLEPQLLTQLLDIINKKESVLPIAKAYGITEREEEVLVLIKKGFSYKEIAAELKISFHTVNHHLKNLYLKLDVNSKAELMARFIK